ncbi:esterase-like activity of phytase family protein [Pseudomonas typographi]|uniref:Esterase-like activity of phytase family protein n=1 Tax=Pseudomonas typographi TaxID=2715964 RepID=A0ABR7YVP5_9PSED|nr:esterase-like activity of phytase family protein [Pseudomonas typographi]MBD1597270.1 esterase-like activity of phytase family protein [Pseudomonas typographi]
MTPWVALLCALLALVPLARAEPLELELVAEHPIDGMPSGNLSGLALCGGQLWGESDRDDDRIYRFDRTHAVWQAEPRRFEVPEPPSSGLAWNIRLAAWAAGFVRGGAHDFEGISCDQAENAYLVSEAHAAVLQVPPSGPARWLAIDPQVVQQARHAGLLQNFNAIFEGLAVAPGGDRLWLAAERERRGLVGLVRHGERWGCDGPCVLLSEDGEQLAPTGLAQRFPLHLDFSDLALYRGKLFTLERNAYRICRRDTTSSDVEACWSFAATARVPARQYHQPYGLTEALAVDAEGAWVGTDNNEQPRNDGEQRPVVWRFAAPPGGWMASP